MLALLYDIHGNLPALEAVVADARAAGARAYLLGGDYALFGAWPAETVEALRDLPSAEWIRGNGERWTADPAAAPDAELVQRAIQASRESLGEATVSELEALPEDLLRNGVHYCHGSPASDVRSFSPEPADDEQELLAGARERRLVFGHTHLQFQRAAGDVELVNPGSVGMPWDGDTRAAYGLMGDDGTLELRRVEYDHATSAAAVRERLGEWAETVARRIERAEFDV